MHNRAGIYGVFVNMRILSHLLIALMCCAGLTALGQSPDVQRVYNALQNIKGELTGYEITARETNVVLNQIVPSLETGANVGVVTNIAHYIYKFGDSAIFISREQFDLSGKLTHKETILATSNEVRKYFNPINHTPIEEIKGVGEVHNGVAEIRPRQKYDMFGVPQYLSELTLRDVLDNAPSRSCDIGESLAGQSCYVISLPGEPDTPIQKYKLFLQSDTLAPVEFNGYLTNGTMYFRADLYFEQPQRAPFLCTKVDVQVFAGDKLHIRSVWMVEHIEKLESPLSEDVMSFIPRGTSVIDSRFSKILNYPMGARPPTPAQIDSMLTSPVGVASYEAGIVISPQSIPNKSEKDNAPRWVNRQMIIRIIVFVVFLAPPVVMIFVALKKKLSKSG